MRHPFQALPDPVGRAWPGVDLVVEGLELALQACLLDTGDQRLLPVHGRRVDRPLTTQHRRGEREPTPPNITD